MKNIYMVQASSVYGDKNFKSAYLPYAAGLLTVYAFSDEFIQANYAFKRFVFFKENIEEAVASFEEPFLVGFSNYVWNTEYNKALACEIKKKYPDCIILFGGHNVPPQGVFLESFPYIDFLIHGEGEEAFRLLLKELLKENRDFSAINNLSFRNDNGEIVTTPELVLEKTDFPSPYLTGIFDYIFDEYPDMQLDAILETSRGCPRRCSYCDWGCLNSKVKLFPLERVFAEIEWFGKHKVAFLWGADANFGAYERDELITDKLIETREKYGYPERLRTNYAKNDYERVFRINRKLEQVGMTKEGATLSFQSLNPETLKCIGRSNMKPEKFKELMRLYKQNGVTTYSELILGLPMETYDSFCRGIGLLLEYGQHRMINVYNCEILPNSPMAQKDYREKYGIKTANVNFLVAHSSKTPIFEKTDYVIGTNTMSTPEWVKANIFACFEKSFHHFGVLAFIAIYLFFEKHIRYEDFYNKVIDTCSRSDRDVLNGAYRFLNNFYHCVAESQSYSLYTNEFFGDMAWPPEFSPMLNVIYRLDEFYAELFPTLLEFETNEDVLNELVSYQKSMIKQVGKNDFSAAFTCDWYGYFTDIMQNDYHPLRKVENRLHIHNENLPATWEEYGRVSVWFGKNSNVFNQGITQEIFAWEEELGEPV